MVLFQRSTPVLDKEGKPIIFEGKELNFDDAYDDNGKWRKDLPISEKSVQRQKDDLILKINAIVRNNHGNYDMDGASIRVKDSTVGRMLSQFRSWMFEGFGTRFEAEYHDNILNIDRKGRYRTFLETRFGYDILAKKGTWENMSKVDKANMRKLFADLSMYVSLFAFGSMLKGLEDEEDGKDFSYINILMNLNLRMQTDIAFYINPADFEHLTKSTIPAMSVISNSLNLVHSMGKFIMGEDTVDKGIYAGDSRLFKATAKMTPGGASAMKIYSSGIQLFEKR